MTDAVPSGAVPTLTVSSSKGRSGHAGYLVIAQGTPFEVGVRDARSLYKFANSGGARAENDPRVIVYHHTASAPLRRQSQRHDLEFLMRLAQGSEWGLPYNFVVGSYHPHRIYYLNDVDQRWPHTLNANYGTAIAAVGNYSQTEPPPTLVARMLALADALAHMWGEWVPEAQHRDYTPTECPGALLAPLLPRMGAQRGILPYTEATSSGGA